MKFLTSIALIIFSTSILLSCQNEYSMEDGTIPALGTLKANGFSDCLPSSVRGTYKSNVTLTAANYIDVDVNLTTAGTYTIKSDTLNGYSFKGVGAIGIPGSQTIRLFGSGKPLTAGINNFTLTFGTSICFIDVTVVP